MNEGAATLRDLISRRAARSAEGVGYVEGATGAALTWGDIGGGVDGWDDLAAAQGPAARAGLLACSPLEMIRGFLGALAAGVLVAPLDPTADLAVQSRRLGLQAAVTDQAAAGSGAALAATRHWILGPSGPRAAAAPPAATPSAATPSAASGPVAAGGGPPAAVILPSSGTTGTPKIIPLNAGQLLATATAIAEDHGLGAGDVGYSPLPLFHINALVVGVLSTLVTGGRLVVDRRFSAGRFWATVAEQEVTWVNLVPAIISILAERDAPPPPVAARVSFARSASAPLPAPVREGFERRTGIGVLETYGMTEAASQIAANPRDPAARRPGSVGLPVGVALRVVDRAGAPLAAGQVGEVQISGPRVVQEYWNAAGADGPPSRAAVGPDGWLATGDLGRLDDDGYLYLVGRMDDVINRGGEKVFPREVEEVLLADPDVSSAAVIGHPHPVVGQEPIAFVLPSAGAGVADLAGRLAERCAANLSRFKRPAQIIVADSLPAGPTGKIQHAELRRAVAAGDVDVPATSNR